MALEKDPVICDLLRSDQKIAAIQRYRQRYGSSLKDAYDAIEEMAVDADRQPDSDADLWEQLTDSTFRTTLEAHIHAGRRITAIQLYRGKYPAPLKYAKRMVLAGSSVLGLNGLPIERKNEEPIETFDIRWSETPHPEKRFLFWKEAEAYIEFRFELQVGEQTFADDFSVSWRDLVASTTSDGEYEVFTCGCGSAGCGGFSPIEVIHLDSRTLWYNPEDEIHWHVFEEAHYKAATSRFKAAILALKQRHPDRNVKFKEEFNNIINSEAIVSEGA